MANAEVIDLTEVRCKLCGDIYPKDQMEFHLVGIHGLDGPKEMYIDDESQECEWTPGGDESSLVRSVPGTQEEEPGTHDSKSIPQNDKEREVVTGAVEMTSTSQIHPGTSEITGDMAAMQSGKLFFTKNDKEKEVTDKAIEMKKEGQTKLKIVYYDLETTNFISKSKEVGSGYSKRFFGNQTVPRSKFGIWIPEIVSVGATTCDFSDTEDFYVEMTPTFQIHPGSSKVSGYAMQSGKLFFTENGKEREVTGAVEMREGLKRFVKYLNNLSEMSQAGHDEEKKKIILV